MQNVLVDFTGDVEDVLANVVDAYALRDVSFLTFAPVGRDIVPHRLEWLMLTQLRRVFTHDDYLLTRQSRSERVLGQYNKFRAIASGGLIVYIGFYPRGV